MPAPVTEPRPDLPADRLPLPEDAQDASYFAASARMRSLAARALSISNPVCVLPICSR
jgi:hypothetical protein